MVNRYRLVYTDDTGTLQEVGRMSFENTGTSPGDATGQLKKARWHPRAQNNKKLSVWADQNLYGELPVAVTDHEGSEPEMLWQEYDGSSWVTKFRGFPTSKGIITENGDVKFTLFSFLQWLGKKRVQLDPDTNSNLVNTDNVTVMQELLPAGYVVDAPAAADVSGGYETIERYRLDDQRRVGFRDLTREINWSLKTLPEKDANGNWKVRYEPDGYGGTVDTIYNKKSQSTGTSPGEFKEWSNLRVKDVVNKAIVIGNNSNRERIVSDPQVNQSSIDTYGERFDRVQVGYVESKSEADRIAQNIVDNKGEPTEGGRVTVAPRYSEDVSNDSFELRDSIRNIDDVYTCVRQINFYPENRSYLDFNFEADAEKKASSRQNLRDERAKVLGSDSENVSGQTGSTAPGVAGDTGSTGPDVAGETGDTGPDVAGDTGSTSPGVGGNTGDTGPDVAGTSDAEESANIDDDLAFETDFTVNDGWNQIGPLADITETALVHEITIELRNMSGGTYNFEIVVVRENSEVVFYDSVQNLNNSNVSDIVGVGTDENYKKTFRIKPGGWETPSPDTDSYELQIKTQGSGNPTLDVLFETKALTHDHGSGSYGADLHPHDDGTLDTDFHPHTDGTLDTDFHPHDDGTLDADNHPHDDGTLGADNHPHDQGTLETVINFISNLAR